MSALQFDQLKRGAESLIQRSLDKQIRLAVTGLSRSGKTAFISSLVNQLVSGASLQNLPFLDVVREGRLLGAKRIPQQNFHVPRFDYESALNAFRSDPPFWPASTDGISEIRLEVRYRTEHPLFKHINDIQTLFIEIVDYPGEWLMDLPMLSMTFEDWSRQMKTLLDKPSRESIFAEFSQSLAKLDPFAPVDELALKSLAETYTKHLRHAKQQHGMHFVQPGRFILPGELEGAPMLQFVPFLSIDEIDMNAYQSAQEDTNIGMLRARFVEYKERVVKRFYKDYFSQFDRQVVLADCLHGLNSGEDGLTELTDALTQILQSFDYGQRSLLHRLFNPKIDKVLFAATKADHVTQDQHANLVGLLEAVVKSGRQRASFEGIDVELMALTAVQVTEQGQSEYQGKLYPSVRGVHGKDRQAMTLYPGDVPQEIPNAAEFEKSDFRYLSFEPLHPLTVQQSLPHIRMDQALQFLLGDKLT